MPVRLLRQIFSMLLMVAYVSATMITVAPTAQAAPHEMSSAMTMKSGDAGDKMPMPCSKGMKAGCVTELGCVFMVSLPTSHTNIATLINWSPVTYAITAEFPPENSIKPALGPPISRT
jgi:hypothetical protein